MLELWLVHMVAVPPNLSMLLPCGENSIHQLSFVSMCSAIQLQNDLSFGRGKSGELQILQLQTTEFAIMNKLCDAEGKRHACF
ncbi:hypothetical protein B0J12DRAFT_648510 [Macrophomina phaseolina]|uniref:Uncharacterized protein n=1 Tax=Macrophomina phaseolina TaxID=35725 RepID=A0ABQ8GPB2_9PEZI|nr:hypothetical protein B0J12DRAFT_648510 [Macrophomina phaseolina]